MRAIVISDETIPEIREYLQSDEAMIRLEQWRYYMKATFAFTVCFVTRMPLDNGHSIPPRAMSWTRLTTDFDGVWGNKNDWFEITPKEGKEMYL